MRRDAGDDGVRAAGEKLKHAAGFVGRARLAEDLTVENDNSVRGNEDRRANRAGGDKVGLGVGETLDHLLRRFIGIRSFVHSGGENGERNAGIAENLGTSRRGGGKDQLHGLVLAERILQRRRSDSCAFGQKREHTDRAGMDDLVRRF